MDDYGWMWLMNVELNQLKYFISMFNYKSPNICLMIDVRVCYGV